MESEQEREPPPHRKLLCLASLSWVGFDAHNSVFVIIVDL